MERAFENFNDNNVFWETLENPSVAVLTLFDKYSDKQDFKVVFGHWDYNEGIWVSNYITLHKNESLEQVFQDLSRPHSYGRRNTGQNTDLFSYIKNSYNPDHDYDVTIGEAGDDILAVTNAHIVPFTPGADEYGAPILILFPDGSTWVPPRSDEPAPSGNDFKHGNPAVYAKNYGWHTVVGPRADCSFSNDDHMYDPECIREFVKNKGSVSYVETDLDIIKTWKSGKALLFVGGLGGRGIGLSEPEEFLTTFLFNNMKIHNHVKYKYPDYYDNCFSPSYDYKNVGKITKDVSENFYDSLISRYILPYNAFDVQTSTYMDDYLIFNFKEFEDGSVRFACLDFDYAIDRAKNENLTLDEIIDSPSKANIAAWKNKFMSQLLQSRESVNTDLSKQKVKK